MPTSDEAARSFGGAAEVYESGRPGYPSEAIRWLLEPVGGPGTGPRVVDVGAGTGKLTDGLLQEGCQVVAVDPDPRMLEVLSARVPGVETRVGRGEDLPLEDHSVDMVTFGQAWHWVDVEAASAEVARVLRPGGTLGLVWNLRDPSTEWVRELEALMPEGNAAAMLRDGPAVGTQFADSEKTTWAWTRPITRDGLVSMVRSRSFYITSGPHDRRRYDEALEALLDRLGVDGEQTVDLPYVTLAFRYRAADAHVPGRT
ncbi:class I SAM-dependent methyltransferase [Actinomycetota bacterium]